MVLFRASTRCYIKLSISRPGGTKLNAIVEVNLVMILKQCYS